MESLWRCWEIIPKTLTNHWPFSNHQDPSRRVVCSQITQLKALREVDQKEEDPSSKTWVFQKVKGKIIWKKDGRMEKQWIYIVFVKEFECFLEWFVFSVGEIHYIYIALFLCQNKQCFGIWEKLDTCLTGVVFGSPFWHFLGQESLSLSHSTA